MQLPIEQWASEVSLPAEALDALREACIAYRAGAYRAGLLFTYVSWGLVIRRRILGSRRPPNVTEKRWDALQKHMQDEDSWDRAVFDATQTKDAAAIFNVREDLRTQVRYWKDRRNDCAHSKNNAITAAYVEALWEFMRWNLDKFVPGGSVEDLLKRIREHFDPNLTRPGASCDELAKLVDSAVPTDRLPDFFGSIRDMSEDSGFFTMIGDGVVAFFEAVMRLGPVHITEPLASFLIGEPELFGTVVREHPTLVHIAKDDPVAVRRLWRTSLGKGDPATVRVYATLLRNGLIPAGEVNEANKHIVSLLRPTPPSEEDSPVLQEHGFFEALRKVAFENKRIDRFSWGNPNAQLLAWYIDKFPIDKLVARTLSDVFFAQPYPDDAQAALKAAFEANDARRAEFEAMIREHDLTWPEPLLGPKPEAETEEDQDLPF